MLSKSNCCSNSHCPSFRTYPVGSTVLEQNTTTRYTMPRSNIFPRPNCHFCSSNRRPHFPLDWGGNTDLPSNNSTRNTTPRLAQSPPRSAPRPTERPRSSRCHATPPRPPRRAPSRRCPADAARRRLPAPRRRGSPPGRFLWPSCALTCLSRRSRAPVPDWNWLSVWAAGSNSGRRRDRRAAQDRSGEAWTRPTHPSVDIARPARAAGPRAPRATS